MLARDDARRRDFTILMTPSQQGMTLDLFHGKLVKGLSTNLWRTLKILVLVTGTIGKPPRESQPHMVPFMLATVTIWLPVRAAYDIAQLLRNDSPLIICQTSQQVHCIRCGETDRRRLPVLVGTAAPHMLWTMGDTKPERCGECSWVHMRHI